MQIRTIMRLIGVLLMMFSFSMLTPLLVDIYYKDGTIAPFITAFCYTFSTGFFLWLPCRHHFKELKTRDGFLIVVLFWLVLCAFASLPFILSPDPHSGLTDAIFESVSGFTTTGATIMTGIEKLPHDILFYRQQLQFLGGMGIIVLAVAILPMLGVGGMQLYRAETPGPLKDAKLTPRITESAKALWLIYLLLTICCGLSYWMAGMQPFDAIGESFSTVATGGFAMHDASFAYYQSTRIDVAGCVFMFLGGTNFTLHFIAFRQRSLLHYFKDEEFRWYLLYLALACTLIATSLLIHEYFKSPGSAIIKSLFNTISLMTTSGFSAAPFSEWPRFVPYLLMLLAIIGGCAGSTSGGIKIIRSLLLFKQSHREIIRLIHPNAIYNVKFGQQTLPRHILQSMWGFISIFLALFILLTLLFLACGNDFVTSFGATTASLANAGVGIGDISSHCADLSIHSKWIMMFGMLAGRLEIFSLLVLLTPSFWQK